MLHVRRKLHRVCGLACTICLACTIAVCLTFAWQETAWAESPATAQKPAASRKPAARIPDGLANYLAKPEPEFEWKLESEQAVGSAKLYRLHLTSQTWQDINWVHPLYVFEPAKIKHPGHMLLFITGGKLGGSPKQEDLLTGALLAQMCGARIATLTLVPNQPLFDGRVEDDLITDTWLKYLETGDESWPLLFPMVKSAVKAMDALQEFSRSRFQQEITGFVPTGASKRGWTTWLTAAADPRVVGAAPMVIDFLNFREQMKHQKRVWGKYSEQIGDYTRKGLIKDDGTPTSPREDRLWAMMDPFTYRAELEQPKLLVVGANDRYWMHDAMNLYWDELKGPKSCLRIPNAGHNLKGGHELVMTTVGAFFRHVADGKPFPTVSGTLERDGGRLTWAMIADQQPESMRIWQTSAPTPDFREAVWTEGAEIQLTDGRYVAQLRESGDKHFAVFGECRFLYDELLYSVSTLLYWE